MKVAPFKAILALGICALTPIAANAGNASGHYSVELNKTEVVYLPDNAGAVVVGNPDIADVSIHSANTIFVVGRGYGETNLVVLNSNGHKIMDADIQVVNNLPNQGVRLYNAKLRETYNCAPYCQPAPVLGDSRAFIGANEGTNAAINNNLASGLPSTFSGSAVTSSTPFGNGENAVPGTIQGGPPPGM